ncbi:hypothetical protein N8I77_006778 [Diaporthe amygdali]|uniref:Fungal N-terminal domain-containing protein n=1 Tax=Phomopsis amygdali TaxID=1214568 RepID=A0AAD9SI28_PHOAM|nr:hypothetical protein N8I77_006778 [Diaporthe amygdali]
MTMEALGAAAAVSQFLVQIIATVNLVKRIKGSSQSLKQYQAQLEGLRGLCEDISNNPALNTEDVQKETQSILHTISTNNDVSILLNKGTFHRAFAFLLKERSFVDLFSLLEYKKTTLSLRVLSINCLAIHEIHNHITIMEAHRQQKTSHYNPPTPPFSPIPNEMSEHHQLTHTGLTSQAPRHASNESGGQSVHGTHETQSAVYMNCEAGDCVNQVNGPTVQGLLLTSQSKFDEIVPQYRGNTALGRGVQSAGLVYQPPRSDGCQVLDYLPVAPGHWEGLRSEALTDVNGNVAAGEQKLGTTVL